jgi:hypothetical protein
MLLQRAKKQTRIERPQGSRPKRGITKGYKRQLKEPKEPGNRETKKEVKKRSET